MAITPREYTSTRLSVADEARLARLDQLLASPELRENFGARALNGKSVVLAVLHFINRGAGESENGTTTGVVRRPVTEHDSNGVDQAKAVHTLPLESHAGPLDDSLNRQGHDGCPMTSITEGA